MFGPNHYVPILRWKQAERLALRNLSEEDRKRITPLIEITPKFFDVPAEGEKKGIEPEPARVLEGRAKMLLESWGCEPFFLDLGHIDGKAPPIRGKLHPLLHIAETVRSHGLYKPHLVPVIALSRTEEYQSAVSSVVALDGHGACLRLIATEVLDSTFARRLQAVLRKLKLEKSSVDLLLDYQKFDDQKPPFKVLFDKLPNLGSWRSVTVASGAFSKDLQEYKPGNHLRPRKDWLSWNQQALSDPNIQRRPSFSDYTIQYGRYDEPPENPNASASIRYTLEDDWLIMRGESINKKDGPGRAQWTSHAILLRDRKDFYSANFSYGDAYIFEMSNKTGKHGSLMTWLRAGINHHMTVVSRQIASLVLP